MYCYDSAVLTNNISTVSLAIVLITVLPINVYCLFTLLFFIHLNNVVMHGIRVLSKVTKLSSYEGDRSRTCARLYSCTPLHIKSDCLTPVIDPCPVIDLHVFGSELTQRP